MKLIIVREPGGLAAFAQALGDGPWIALGESYRATGGESLPGSCQRFKDFVRAAAESLDAEVEDRS